MRSSRCSAARAAASPPCCASSPASCRPARARWRSAGAAGRGPAQEVAMVFQTFALFPWLTVLENVEIGLEALRIDSAERHKRALAAIDLIGLDGYESAYPKELSGGMRPRGGGAPAPRGPPPR